MIRPTCRQHVAVPMRLTVVDMPKFSGPSGAEYLEQRTKVRRLWRCKVKDCPFVQVYATTARPKRAACIHCGNRVDSAMHFLAAVCKKCRQSSSNHA
jgi:hypothetical protein